MLVRVLFPCLVTLSLTACGGSSSGSDAVIDPNLGPLTSGVVEGPVAGLRYETGSKSGMTDENGTFSYRTGEQVRFYVGDILVGEADGAESLTLFNLAGPDAPPVTATEVRATINQMDAPQFATPLETPFETAANIAALLYTLDQDGNSSNGIVIPPAIHLLATGPAFRSDGIQLSLDGPLPLYKLLIDAQRANVWPTARAFRNRSLAMDALYASLGLVPEIFVNTTIEIDNGDNGDIDAIYTSTYDANGFFNDDHLDKNNDGTADTGVEHRYDAAGNITSASNFLAGSRFTLLFTIDDRGGQTKLEEIYADERGIPNKVTHFTADNFSYDTTASVDSDANGSIDALEYYRRDADGRLVSIDKDTDNDGAIELQDLFYYDSQGRETRRELDVTPLGVPGAIDTLTWNAYGQRQTISHDADGDGHDDSVTEYQYNSRHQLIRMTRNEDADGTIENDYYWHYDDNGYLLEEGSRVTSPVSHNSITTYTRDALGNVLTSDLDYDGDGIFDETSTYIYDANGNLTEVVRRQSDNGVIISRSSYSNQKTSHWGYILTPPDWTYSVDTFPR